MAAERKRLLASITATASDYKGGGVITPEHIEKWVTQFPDDAQVPILREMGHVLERTYFTKKVVEDFLKKLLLSKKLAGDDPTAFWKRVKFLAIQERGGSQRDMLALLDGLLKKSLGYGVADCGKRADTFIYIDDGVFTGNHVRRDVEKWITSDAPNKATLHIATIGLHTNGQGFISGKIASAKRASCKEIDVKWWRAVEVEDQLQQNDNSELLPVR